MNFSLQSLNSMVISCGVGVVSICAYLASDDFRLQKFISLRLIFQWKCDGVGRWQFRVETGCGDDDGVDGDVITILLPVSFTPNFCPRAPCVEKQTNK